MQLISEKVISAFRSMGTNLSVTRTVAFLSCFYLSPLGKRHLHVCTWAVEAGDRAKVTNSRLQGAELGHIQPWSYGQAAAQP